MSYPLPASLSVETGAAPHILRQVFQRIPTMLLGQPHWLLFLNTTGHSHRKSVTSSKLVLGLFIQNPSHWLSQMALGTSQVLCTPAPPPKEDGWPQSPLTQALISCLRSGHPHCYKFHATWLAAGLSVDLLLGQMADPTTCESLRRSLASLPHWLPLVSILSFEGEKKNFSELWEAWVSPSLLGVQRWSHCLPPRKNPLAAIASRGCFSLADTDSPEPPQVARSTA